MRLLLPNCPDKSSSWFIQIRHLCSQYSLPSPLVKKKVVDFWQQKLREQAKPKHLPSLAYFKPDFMSLQKPHPLWTTSKANPFEINKSIVVARLLSGRYRSDWLARHWSKDNKLGYCTLCPGEDVPGTIEHMLATCNGLSLKRADLILYWKQQTEENHHLQLLTQTMLGAPVTDFVQFVLDPSVVPMVILDCQQELYTINDVFALTRTFCYGLHRRRQPLLGKFKISL